jgi:hypothetical protein
MRPLRRGGDIVTAQAASVAVDTPAWITFMSPLQLRQLAAHEQAIRDMERARERRRMEPLMATTGTTPCREESDLEGCTL